MWLRTLGIRLVPTTLIMELDRRGFVYAGRPLASPVLKIGFTTSRDPLSYIQRRYAGLLKLENLMAVSNAPDAERLLHFALKDYRHEGARSRELFKDCPPPHDIQALFCWAAQLVNRDVQLREFADAHGILLEGDSHRVHCKRITYDSEDD